MVHSYSCRALGITCIEMAEGAPPYSNIDSSLKVIMKITQSDEPTLNENEAWNEPLRSFLRDCLQKKPESRLTATALLKKHKNLWDKAKDRKYLVKSLKIVQNTLQLKTNFSSNHSLASDGNSSYVSLDSGLLSSQNSSIKIPWNFDFSEEEVDQ